MKKILYLLLFFQSFQFSYSTNNFNLKPIIIDFYGAEAWDSTIIAYGSGGNYWITKNEFKNYTEGKVFEKDIIIKMIKEENRIIAFSINGKISVSYNNAISWVQMEDLFLNDNEELFGEFIKVDNKYLCRTKNYIYLVNSNLQIEKSVEDRILYPYFSGFNNDYHLKPLCFVNQYIYSIVNSYNINMFDKNLVFIKTINTKDIIDLDNPEILPPTFYPVSDIEIGLQFKKKIYKFNSNLSEYKLLSDNSTITQGQNVNGKLFCNHSGISLYELNENDTIIQIKDLVYNYISRYHPKNKALIYNNKIIVVGFSNLIIIADLDKNSNIINYITHGSTRNKENLIFSDIKINNQFLTLRDFDGSYGSDLFTLNLNDNKFNGLINRLDTNNKYFDGGNSRNATFQTIFYDEVGDILYMGSNHRVQDENALFISENKGKSFKRYNVNFITQYGNSTNYQMKKTKDGNNLQGVYNNKIWNTGEDFTGIDIFSKDIKSLFAHVLRNEKFINSDIIDTLNYLALSENTKIRQLQFKSTTDKGETWEVHKEYPNTTNLLESKELEINGKKIWAYTYYDFVKSQFILDVINVEERKVYNVFSSQLTQDQIDSIDNIGFDAAKEKFYLSFFNTLMVSSNIFEDNIKWETFNYPNNGKVNKKFQIFDKTIFARYEDDKNEDNVYWINGIEMVGDPTSVENTEEVSYLYTMTPYPNPSVSEVTAKFYWDSRIDIDNSDIAVFDITGNKVSGKENLTLEKLNDWSGNIKWNCANQPKGTYLIKIQHGNNTKTVKVVVN